MATTLPIEPTTPENDDVEFDLVSILLQDQNSLTAVERFSELHENGSSHLHTEPAQSKYYRSLLPATPPGPGQQYAFHVDLDACSGCKACVVACHTMNGLEEEESWRRVGTVTLSESPSRIQHVTTACHHCSDPGCLSGCPVKAYDKDPQTGIVRHLDDQCIGCKYCTMMCPYEVPRYSDRLGIVRKCDMCHQRLQVGEAPACVQSCPNEAISIELIEVADQAFDAEDRIAPGAPKSTITRPSTRYSSTAVGESSSDRGLAFPSSAVAQDARVDVVAENHWPLAVMLVATQLAVGVLLFERVSAAVLWSTGGTMPPAATRWTALVALLISAVGLNLAQLHLGKPLRAWRVFLGLKTSWLSREAVVLGKFFGTLAIATGLTWMPVFADRIPESVLAWIPDWAGGATLSAAVLLGLVGLSSSAMIYVATQRLLWRPHRTFMRFFGTTLIGGALLAAITLTIGEAPTITIGSMLVIAMIALTVKLDWEFRIHLGRRRVNDEGHDARSRILVHRHLAKTRDLRLRSAVIGSILAACTIPASMMLPLPWTVALATTAAVAVTCGEICERLLYFSSVVYDRMPGILR